MKQKLKEKMNIKRISLGVILIPVFIAVYFIDRAICLINPFLNHPRLRAWFNDEEEMKHSFVRFIVFFLLVGLISLIKYFA